MTIQFDLLETLGLASLVVGVGHGLRKIVPWLEKMNFPAPVVGGITTSVCMVLLKHFDLLILKFDTTLQLPLMMGFFASIGFAASVRSLKSGGKLVFLFFVLTVISLFLQTGLGLALAHGLDLPLSLGLLTGPVALTGGPGTALAFAQTFEQAGVQNASSVGLAAAMGGILSGAFLGTPLSTWLIQKQQLGSNLKPSEKSQDSFHQIDHKIEYSGIALLESSLVLAFVIGTGKMLSSVIQEYGITLPVYIGSMIIAALVRNFDDHLEKPRINHNLIEDIGTVCLYLFISMVLMTLDLAPLFNVAGSLIVILSVHAALILLIGVFVIHRWMGQNYDSAVMAGGFVGFMMGTTANSMANMTAITHRYGPSPKSFLVIPLVGACFIDFVNAAVVTGVLNLIR